MGTCYSSHNRKHTETKSAQTDMHSFCTNPKANRDLLNSKYQNFRPTPIHSNKFNNKHHLDHNIQLKNSIMNDWRHPSRFDQNYSKSEMINSEMGAPMPYGNELTKPQVIKEAISPNSTGVWPINGSGDFAVETSGKKKRRNSSLKSQSNQKSMLNLNLSDEEINHFTGTNLGENGVHYDCQFNSDIHAESVKDEKPTTKPNNTKSVHIKPKDRPNTNSNKPKKTSHQKLKSFNNNSNNYHQILENEKLNGGHVMNSQKFHSSSLLDQDCYPIQYTFYVDDNDNCTKPFYDRRMVAIAKTCRCRIYFHAKSDDNEKPLYYKGKPVRPVTITSPDMACLKRCLGSVDSQFPYFNCKAFLSLNN